MKERSIPNKLEYRKKTPLWILLRLLKEELKEYENHILLSLCNPPFKIKNKNRKTYCKICPKLKVPDQLCETFFQMCSVLLTSLHSLNFAFPLLFYVIYTAIPKLHPHPIFRILTLILQTPLSLLPNSPFQLLQTACSVCNLEEFIFRK